MSEDDKERKYEQEIRQLLDSMPEFLPDRESRSPIPLRKPRTSRRIAPRLIEELVASPRNVAILAFISLAVSYFIRPYSPRFAPYFGIAAAALLVIALGLAVFYGRQRKYERRWRGRTIGLPSDTPAWQRSVEQWWWRLRANLRHWRRR